MKITNENYCVIQGWMLNIGCSNWNEIAAYALIYGFSQDGQSEFTGSISYIQEWLKCSRPTAVSTMKKLVEIGLVKKTQVNINNVIFNRYSAVIPNANSDGGINSLLVVKNFNQGSKNSLPNNDVYNNTPLYNSPLTGEIIYPPEGETTPKNKTKKSEKAKEKKELDMSCVPVSFKEVVDVWIKYKKEKQQNYKQIGFDAMVEKLIKYSNGNPETAKEIILDAMSNNYSGFFPLKRGAETPNHLQNLPPEYINLKNEQNGNNHTNTPTRTGQRTISLDGIAQSILAGCEAGRNRR